MGRIPEDIDRDRIEALVRQVLAELMRERPGGRDSDRLQVQVGVSSRHVHISVVDLERLFGKGYELTRVRELQPGQYATKECVTLVGPRGVLQNVRILGPVRANTQVEVSRTDGYLLGVNPPVRDSGSHEGTPGVFMLGPRGAIELERGVIAALRHIHMPPEVAERHGLADKQMVRVRSTGERRVVFEDVLVRVSPEYRLEFHLDTDEANASGLKTGDTVVMLV